MKRIENKGGFDEAYVEETVRGMSNVRLTLIDGYLYASSVLNGRRESLYQVDAWTLLISNRRSDVISWKAKAIKNKAKRRFGRRIFSGRQVDFRVARELEAFLKLFNKLLDEKRKICNELSKKRGKPSVIYCFLEEVRRA